MSVEHVIEKFDFAEVRKAMVALEWSYWDTGGRIPSIDQLKAAARYLLDEVVKEKSACMDTGGFEAKKDAEGHLHLRFVIEECSDE